MERRSPRPGRAASRSRNAGNLPTEEKIVKTSPYRRRWTASAPTASRSLWVRWSTRAFRSRAASTTRSSAGESVVDAARERKARVLHLTHNDLDAVGADAVHRRRYGDVFTIFSSVGKFPAFLAVSYTHLRAHE